MHVAALCSAHRKLETAWVSKNEKEKDMAFKGIAIAGQTPGEAAWSIFMFVLSIAITAAFAYYLVTDPNRLTELFAWTRSLNILFQGVIWLLFLPWMIALWMLTLPWAMPVQLVLVICALAFTNWLLFPWKA